MTAEIKRLDGSEDDVSADRRSDMLAHVARKIDEMPDADSIVFVVLNRKGFAIGWDIEETARIAAEITYAGQLLTLAGLDPDPEGD